MAIAKDAGTVAGTTPTDWIQLKDNFTLQLIGSAVVDLERSFDDGVTPSLVKAYTGSATVNENGFEPMNGVLYRLNPTSGTSTYVLGR